MQFKVFLHFKGESIAKKLDEALCTSSDDISGIY